MLIFASALALSGCVSHTRHAFAVEGISTIEDYNTKTCPRNKYHVAEYVFGGSQIKIGDAEQVNNIIKSSGKWSRVFVPKKHWLSFAKQEGIPVRVEVIGDQSSWWSWFGYQAPVDIIVTVNGERFSDDPVSVHSDYDYCSKCGETEYKPGTPNCQFKQLDENYYWIISSSYYFYGFHGGNGANEYLATELNVLLTAVSKKLKELEDDGVIPIQ